MNEDKIKEMLKQVAEESAVKAKEEVAKLLASKEDEAKKKATATELKVADWDDKKKAVEFLKATLKGDMNMVAKLGQKDLDTGDITIPQGWANEIYSELNEGAIARANSMVIPMPNKTMNLPKGSGVTVYWGTEGTAPTNNSEPTFTNTQLVAKELMGLAEVSRDLIEDANASVIDFVTGQIVDAIGKEETNQWLNGNGSSPSITGILQSSDVTSVVMDTTKTEFGHVDHEELINLISAVPARKRNGAKFYMSDSVFAVVKKLKDSSNRPLYQALTEADRGMLLGYPVVITETAPATSASAASTPFIAFGNTMKGMVIGDRRLITVDVSTHYKFAERQVALLVTERVDMAVHMGGYLAKLVTAAS